jgi:hypothetical protein
MENFYYEDVFCSDLSDLLSALGYEEEDVSGLPDDWKAEVMGAKLEKMFVLTKGFISSWTAEHAHTQYDERYPEDPSIMDARIAKAIEAGIDIDKINEGIPSMYYPDDAEVTITKSDLVEWCKLNGIVQ